jgi:hypothetical protein
VIFVPSIAALALGYLCSDPYCRSRVDTGIPNDPTAHCLYWQDTSIQFDQSSVGNPATGPSVFTSTAAAWSTWQQAAQGCSLLSLTEGPRSASRAIGYSPDGGNENLVLYRQKGCQSVSQSDPCWAAQDCNNVYDCWSYQTGTIALTTTTYDTGSGTIFDADIELNAADFVFTTVDAPECLPNAQSQSCVATDVQNTMTHETGHALGLDHNTNPLSTMYNSAPLGETSKRVLDPGSRQFVCDVYSADFAWRSRDCVPDAVPSAGSCDSVGGPMGAGVMVAAAAGALGLLRAARRGRR